MIFEENSMLKRSFTVKTALSEKNELLTIEKKDLSHMRTAFGDSFGKMIRDAI